MEIYNEKIRDLLNPDPKTNNDLKVRSSAKGTFVEGTKPKVVNSFKEIDDTMEQVMTRPAPRGTASPIHSPFLCAARRRNRRTRRNHPSAPLRSLPPPLAAGYGLAYCRCDPDERHLVARAHDYGDPRRPNH